MTAPGEAVQILPKGAGHRRSGGNRDRNGFRPPPIFGECGAPLRRFKARPSGVQKVSVVSTNGPQMVSWSRKVPLPLSAAV
jgi:hypothetical protein